MRNLQVGKGRKRRRVEDSIETTRNLGVCCPAMDISRLLAMRDGEELRRRWADVKVNTTGQLNMREFVELMRVLLQDHITDQVQFAVQAMDVFRQVDLSSKGSISFKEFSNHIMHLDVLSDEAILFRSFRYRRCLVTMEDFHNMPIVHLSYYGAPVDRLFVITEKSDHVHLYVPPEAENELPRPSISLGHFAVLGHMRVLGCEHLGEEYGVVTSTCTEDNSAYYLNYWELPRSKIQDRGPDSVFIPTMRNRIRVVNPQTVLLRSSMGMLLTSSDSANYVQVWRINNHRLRPIKKFTVSTRPITCLLEVRWLGVGFCVLVTGSKDGSVTLIDLTRMTIERDLTIKQVTIQTIRAHEYGVVAMCQSKKHRVMFTAGVFREENTCRVSVWRSILGAEQAGLVHDGQVSLAGHAYQVVDMRVVDEEDQLITADISGELRVWDLPELTLQQVIYSRRCDRKTNPLRTLTVFGPTSEYKSHPRTIMVASNVVEMYQKTRVRQKDSIVSSFYNDKFKNFVVVGAQRIYMWDAYTGHLAKTYDITSLLQGKAGEITACCLGDEGSRILFGDDKGRIFVCSYNFGTLLRQLDPHQGPVTWLYYCQMDKTVVSAGADGKIRVLDDRDPDGFVEGDPSKALLGRSVTLKEISLCQSRPSSRGKVQSDQRSATSSTSKSQLLQRADATEVMLGACSPEFNLIATVSANTSDVADVNVWDYEMAGLLGTVLQPETREGKGSSSSSCFAATAIAFCTPVPLLAGGTDHGAVHLWKLPSMDYAATLSARRTRRSSVEKRRASVSGGGGPAVASPVEELPPAGITTIASGRVGGEVLAVYAGDEYGCITVWFLDEVLLEDLTHDEDDKDEDEDDDNDDADDDKSRNQRDDQEQQRRHPVQKAGGANDEGLGPKVQVSSCASSCSSSSGSSAFKSNSSGSSSSTSSQIRKLPPEIAALFARTPAGERETSGNDQDSHHSDQQSVASSVGGGSNGSSRGVSSHGSGSRYYKGFSKRYTQRGYNAHRIMRVKVLTERLVLLRRTASRHQESRGTRRRMLPSTRQWEAHQDRVSSLAFIESSLTLLSAGADNMLHLWDAAKGALIGTLDLQEPGTHVDAWNYLVVDNQADQAALIRHEAKKMLLSSKELQRMASRRKKALRRRLRTVKVVMRMGLLEPPSPADILREQALQAIRDSPSSSNSLAGGEANQDNDGALSDHNSSTSSKGSKKKMRKKKAKVTEATRLSTWGDILANAQQSEAFVEENNLLAAARAPTARELRRRRLLEEGSRSSRSSSKPASAVSSVLQTRGGSAEGGYFSFSPSRGSDNDELLRTMMLLGDGEQQQGGSAVAMLPPMSRARSCGCPMRHHETPSTGHGPHPHATTCTETLLMSGPFPKDPLSTQYVMDKPFVLSRGTTVSRASIGSNGSSVGSRAGWRMDRGKVVVEEELHRDYLKMIRDREREEAHHWRHVKHDKLLAKGRRVRPPRRRKELLITIINKLNHIEKTSLTHANPGIQVKAEILRLTKIH